MKKYNYSVTVNHVVAVRVITQSFSGDIAETIVKQAHMKRDIQYMSERGLVIIPWSAVVSIEYRVTTQTVDATGDDVCKEYVEKAITLGSTITDAVAARYEGPGEKSTVLYYKDGTSQTIRPSDSNSVKALVDSVIIDGEDVTDTAKYSYTGMNVGTQVSMTFTATVGDNSVSKTVKLPYRDA